MHIHLQNIVPTYLADRLGAGSSPLWGKQASLAPGSKLFVKAPSGKGKTTLIHILYGLNIDYSGELKWDNTTVKQVSDAALSATRSEKLAVIFQDMRLFPTLTAGENIELKRAQTNSVPLARIDEWLQRLGMGDKKNALAGTLSFGEQQRIAIVRALAQPFHWLLMDEPFSHLDNNNRERAAALITERVKELNAGFVFADLEQNQHFAYTETLTI